MSYSKKIIKIAGIGLSGILLLIMILIFLVRAGTLNGLIASFLSKQVSDKIEAEFSIKQVEGNLFSRFSLEDLTVVHADSTVLSLESLHVDYSLSRLFSREVKVNFIRLNHLYVNANQKEDSTWNFQTMLPEKRQRQEKVVPAKEDQWVIQLDVIRIDSLKAWLSPLKKEQIPSELHAGFRGSFKMVNDSLLAEVERFSAETRSPGLQIKNMSGTFELLQNYFNWKNFELEMASTQVRSHGNLNLDSLLVSKVDLNFNPLDLNEFKPWMSSFHLNGTPKVELELNNNGKRSDISFYLQEGTQKVWAKGWYDQRGNQPQYDVTLWVDSLDGQHWTGNAELKSLINGKMSVQGSGINYQENTLDAQGNFGNLLYGDYELNDLVFHVNKKQSDITGNVETDAWFGDISAEFHLEKIFKKIKYDVKALIQNLDLSKISADYKLHSSLNFQLQAAGEGMHPDSMKTRTHLKIFRSTFLNHPVDSMNASIFYDNYNYEIKGLDLNTPIASLHVNGKGHIRKNNQLEFRTEFRDISPLLRALNIPSSAFTGTFSGNLAGSYDSTSLDFYYDLENIRYDSVYAESLAGEGKALYKDSVVSGETSLQAHSLMLDSNRINKIALQANYQPNILDSRISVTLHDSLSLYLDSRLASFKNPVISLNEISLHAWEDFWKGGSDSTSIVMAEDSIEIQNFNMQSDSQRVNIHGTYSFKGKENLQVSLEHINLEVMSRLADFQYNVRGMLNASLLLEDSAKTPVITGKIEIDKPALNGVNLNSIRSNIHYASDSLFWDGFITGKYGTMLKASAMIPFHFSLMDTVMLPGPSTPLQAEVLVNEMDMASFKPFIEKTGFELNGRLSGLLSISNTLGEPHLNGNMDVLKGRLKHSKLGINYSDITLNSKFSNRKIFLTRLQMNSGKGYLKADGTMDLERLDSEGNNKIQFNLKGREFQALKSKQLSATVNPDIKIEGTLEKPVLKGEVKVVRSQINSDALLARFSEKTDNPNPPLLVEALKDTLQQVSQQTDSLPVDKKKTPKINFYKNLRGTFDVIIPGNTWVRGKDINFELKGDLQAIKRGETIDLFGTLNINRGHIKYYGRKFDFERGSLTFTGGKEIKPRLDFIIAYDFRSANRELQTLSVHITGNSQQPKFAFYLDEKKLQEKQALSYIIFGKSINQLTASEEVSVEQSAAEMAASVALGQVSNLVNDALQNTLGLDMVEIAGDGTWKSGRVKIGKYITDDLYLSYQQTFAFDKKEKTIEPEKVTLEYKILRSLFLQATNQGANSGFDLIFKKTWK